jgi:hypothetical protein
MKKHYFPIIRRKNNQLKGTLLIIVQSKLLKKKLFGIFKKWERKILILWKPDFKENAELRENPVFGKIKEDQWLILKNAFRKYSDEIINIKHICGNKTLLEKLIKY